MSNRRVCPGLLATCMAFGPGCTLAASGADLILTNGHVYTADAKSRWAEAVAVKGGKIAYVGSMC